VKKIILVLACLAAGAACAQEYPSRPIRVVVPYSAGGSSDGPMRVIAQEMSKQLGQQMVVENKPGQGAMLGSAEVVKAPPDGYTLLLAYHQHTVNAALNPKLPYHPVNSFTPITQLTTAGLMLVVNPATPVTNLKEFVDWTKNFKGPLNYGSAGLGTGGHLAGELYKLMTGVKAEHIPYKGSGPALMDLLAGQYHFNFAGIQAAQVQVRAGKLRGLAVTAPRRLAALPDLPAVAEALPGFEVVGWYGVIGPAGLPRPVVARLHDEFVRVLNRPDIRERIVADGSEPAGTTPEEFRLFMLADLAKWAKLVKESGAKLD
jgi:tripartite-type tricarboxylate transporter receptor subunit TctC